MMLNIIKEVGHPYMTFPFRVPMGAEIHLNLSIGITRGDLKRYLEDSHDGKKRKEKRGTKYNLSLQMVSALTSYI